MELKDIKFTDCILNQYKYLIIIAENEFVNNQIVIKDLENKTQSVIN
jgi:histidyl-tRNA synthetase